MVTYLTSLLAIFSTVISLTPTSDPNGVHAAETHELLSKILDFDNYEQLVFITQVVSTVLAADAVYMHGTLRRRCVNSTAYLSLRQLVGPMIYVFADTVMNIPNLLSPDLWTRAEATATTDNNDNNNNNAPPPTEAGVRTPPPFVPPPATGSLENPLFSPTRAPEAPLSTAELERLLLQFPAGPAREGVRANLEAMQKHNDEIARRASLLGNTITDNPLLYTDVQAKQSEAIGLIVQEMRDARSKAKFDVDDLKAEGTSVGPVKNLKISAHVLLHRLSGKTVSTDNFVEVIQNGVKTFELKDKQARDDAMQNLDAFGYRHANNLIKAKHIRAIKCVDPEGKDYNIASWSEHYDYFTNQIEETWHYFNRSIALEVDSCIRELVATEINPLHPATQTFETCDRYRDAMMQIKTRRLVVASGSSHTVPGAGSNQNEGSKQTQGLYKDSSGIVRGTRATQAHLKAQKICWFYNLDKCTKADCKWKHVCCIKGCNKSHPALSNHQLTTAGGQRGH